MDFSPLTDVLASKSYDKIADTCDTLMLQAAAQGIAYQDEWPYAIHLLGHIYVDDVNSARFLWKTIPAPIKESRPEIGAVWKVVQKLWTRDHAGVHNALFEFNWNPQARSIVDSFSDIYTKRMFNLMLSAYSTISAEDTARFLGMHVDEAIEYLVEQGWILEPISGMLIVTKQAIGTEQRLDPSKLQRLTEYVFHLEH